MAKGKETVIKVANTVEKVSNVANYVYPPNWIGNVVDRVVKRRINKKIEEVIEGRLDVRLGTNKNEPVSKEVAIVARHVESTNRENIALAGEIVNLHEREQVLVQIGQLLPDAIRRKKMDTQGQNPPEFYREEKETLRGTRGVPESITPKGMGPIEGAKKILEFTKTAAELPKDVEEDARQAMNKAREEGKFDSIVSRVKNSLQISAKTIRNYCATAIGSVGWGALVGVEKGVEFVSGMIAQSVPGLALKAGEISQLLNAAPLLGTVLKTVGIVGGVLANPLVVGVSTAVTLAVLTPIALYIYNNRKKAILADKNELVKESVESTQVHTQRKEAKEALETNVSSVTQQLTDLQKSYNNEARKYSQDRLSVNFASATTEQLEECKTQLENEVNKPTKTEQLVQTVTVDHSGIAQCVNSETGSRTQLALFAVENVGRYSARYVRLPIQSQNGECVVKVNPNKGTQIVAFVELASNDPDMGVTIASDKFENVLSRQTTSDTQSYRQRLTAVGTDPNAEAIASEAARDSGLWNRFNENRTFCVATSLMSEARNPVFIYDGVFSLVPRVNGTFTLTGGFRGAMMETLCLGVYGGDRDEQDSSVLQGAFKVKAVPNN
jgi:hypothetical protein